jgi:hypothetical protein
MPIKFDQDNSTPSEKAMGWFAMIVLATLPFWMPYCIPDMEKDCKYVCERIDGKQFIEVDHSGAIPGCHCGRKLNKLDSIELRQP